MITGIEHIGIAVKNLDNAEAIYEKLLGVASYKREEVGSENVITSFFKKGQKIGLMGRTGRASGTHLHFEIRKDRGPVDPLAVLPAISKDKKASFIQENETRKLARYSEIILR